MKGKTLFQQDEQQTNFPLEDVNSSFDYSYVSYPARVAVYDDMKMAPRIIQVDPAPTNEFIEKLASTIDEQRLKQGGSVPYSAIREVTENFIHAQFNEVVVSVLDNGNTIRFCDQGPGINNKEQALRPGFTSATEEMKDYIRGVGSGLPLVKEYLDYSHGKITIEDNMGNGSVVTISLIEDKKSQSQKIPIPPLNTRERDALLFFASEGAVGNKELAEYLEIAPSSANFVLKHLEEYGLVEKSYKSKRILTTLGSEISQQI